MSRLLDLFKTAERRQHPIKEALSLEEVRAFSEAAGAQALLAQIESDKQHGAQAHRRENGASPPRLGLEEAVPASARRVDAKARSPAKSRPLRAKKGRNAADAVDGISQFQLRYEPERGW